MRRVVILGPGGAGKSTLARELGARTGLAVFHLDRYYWMPEWVPTPDDEWGRRSRPRVLGAIERDARHADLQVFRSPREVSTWLETLGGTLESDT